MSNDHNTEIGKQEVLALLEDARALRRAYLSERKRDKRNDYVPPSLDVMALHLFERREGRFAISMTLNRGNLNVSMVDGAITADGYLEHIDRGRTTTYTLENFRGTTVARFAETVCKVLRARAASPDQALVSVMPPQNRTDRTMTHVHEYACR